MISSKSLAARLWFPSRSLPELVILPLRQRSQWLATDLNRYTSWYGDVLPGKSEPRRFELSILSISRSTTPELQVTARRRTGGVCKSLRFETSEGPVPALRANG
jgi:hypothetical protein